MGSKHQHSHWQEAGTNCPHKPYSDRTTPRMETPQRLVICKYAHLKDNNSYKQSLISGRSRHALGRRPYAKAQTHNADKGVDRHHFHAKNRGTKTGTGTGPWLYSPLAELRQFNVQESELPCLAADQIHDLLSELQKGKNRHAAIVARVCLATGARWSEAGRLKIRAPVQEPESIGEHLIREGALPPIESKLAQQLRSHHLKAETGQRVFAPCNAAFLNAVKRSGLELQDEQFTHLLRHTFASQFTATS